MPGHIPPSAWGPFFWHTIHLVALGYPSSPNYAQKKAAKEFYESLQELIPCPICKEHYKQKLVENPIVSSLDKREDLFRWTVLIHNLVNQDLKKPQYTEQQSIAFYEKLGELGRSPVWTPEDFQALEYSTFLKGMGTSAAILLLGGGIAWYLSRKE